MKIIIIGAIAKNGAIGKDNNIPWGRKQRQDMIRFFRLTKGYPIIMGRKTYESLPERPLKLRTNIVITRQSSYTGPDGFVRVNSTEEAITIAKSEKKDKTFIIGGAEIYKLTLDLADELYITHIQHDFEADTFFPLTDFSGWIEGERFDYSPDQDNTYPCSFVHYIRKT